ncbi:hypothetical protein R2601_03278 [Salipiger bermudensis HTCC2601]|uniref:Uncharacterized protein n=1 Tax=Salipiger bermudensis (strain DSM 26914 / JCM 13377 / KCTC 12554 / HTCC2601) TaxID=314265 RepID=Q0FWJ0_SALBH|nr:hypothetical protein R2601_03278 [Salipiger bermudensis HTCC2601]
MSMILLLYQTLNRDLFAAAERVSSILI